MIDERSLSSISTPFMQQSEATECALACLAMIASAHGYETNIAALRRKFPISLKGATLKQVIEIAEAIGLIARPIRADISDLSKLALPAILHWNFRHFVVLTRISTGWQGTRYHVHDPASGPVSIEQRELSAKWTGVAVELSKASSFVARIERQKLAISQLWSSISGFWQTAGQLLTLSVILQIAALSVPFYIQTAIDTVLPAGDHRLIQTLALGFGGLAIIELLANWLRSVILINLSNTLSFHIIINLFRHLVRLPASWFEKRHVGDIISRFNSTQPVSQLLSNGMIAALLDGVMALATFALMLIYSPLLASVAASAVILYSALRLSLFQVLRLRNIGTITANAAEQSAFIESVRGIQTIKAFGQETNRQRMWQQKKSDANNAAIRLGRLNAGFDAGSQFVVALERVIFVYLVTMMTMEGRFTVGMIFAFQGYKQQFIEAGMRLVGQTMNIRILQLHLARISDIALAPRENHGKEQLDPPLRCEGHISLHNVTFSYGAGEAPILVGVNLEIGAGKMVAVVGPSGGGKTTLVKIMMGLLDPSYGSAKIDDVSLRSVDRSALRAHIGSVSQGDVLFAGTLAENISFFDPEPDTERIVEVAKLVGIHQEIEAMPLRYHSLVGDMGSALSGGQRQRVMLARALYARPSILFMDEGTANLDSLSESRVIAAMKSLDITRIVVAHQSRSIDAADEIYLVDGRTVTRVQKRTAVEDGSVLQHA